MCGTNKINVSQSSKGSSFSNEYEIDNTMPKGPTGSKSKSPTNEIDFEECDEYGLIHLNGPEGNNRINQDVEQIPQEISISPERTQEILDNNYKRLDKMMQIAAKKSYKNVSFNDLENLAANILGNDLEQQRNLQIISRNLTTAMAALDKMKGKDLYTWKFFKGYVVSQEVTNAINAQMDMAEAIRVLERHCDPQNEAALSALGLLRNRCEMRATEISRLAGEMQEYIVSKDKNHDALLNRTVKNMLPEMASKMHGTSDAIQHMKAYVAPLLQTINDFESSSKIANTTTDIEILRGNIMHMTKALEYAKKNGIDYGKDYSSPNSLQAHQEDKSSRVMVDVEILDGMIAFLEEKKEKLNHWRFSITMSMTNTFVTKEMKKYNFEPILTTLNQCPLNQGKFSRIQYFMRDLQEYMELKSVMLDLCKATTSTEATTKARELEKKLDNGSWYRITSKALVQDLVNLQKTVDDKQTKEELKAIQHAVKDGVFDFLLSSLCNIHAIGRQLLVIANRCKPELNEVVQQSDLAAIFKGDTDFSVILEARIHGAEDGDVNPDFAPKNLVSRKPLGAGAMNTVEKCEFRKADGSIITGIFKNEISSRTFLGFSGLGQLGEYNDDQRNYNLNIACMENAKLFGLENVIAKCSVGVLEGQYGFFMEEAPGASPATLEETYLAPIDTKPGELSTYHLRSLNSKDKWILKGNLRRELSNLQWLDIINGQGDRHNDNYFVQFKDDLTVKITGIDNDASFPMSRMDVATFVFANNQKMGTFLHEELSEVIVKFAKNEADARNIWNDLYAMQIIGGKDVMMKGKKVELITYIDMSKIPSGKPRLREILSQLLYNVGMKNISYPKVIDKKTKDKFLGVYNSTEKLTNWKVNLEKRMSKEAAKATLLRFDCLCTYIKNMPPENVIDGEGWNRDWKIDNTKVCPNSEEANFINKDLFDRDFEYLW